ncbi:MAG: ROK family protein [Bacillaceae bacterium]|nr:ROK family protein [Bacillaceae bacterium]
MLTGNYEIIKSVNISLVLDALRHHEQLSRSDIARLTGLTTGTITNIVHKLIDHGLVEETGSSTSSTGGRKPILLRLAARGAYAIGIEVTTTGIKGMLVNFLAEPIHTLEKPGVFRYQQGLYSIADLIKELQQHLPDEQDKLLGVGISLPGWVHFATGKVQNLPNLPGWENVNLKDDLEQEIRLPVFIDNDANLGALGELWFGKGRMYQQLIYILVEDGIGSGFVFNHQVYHGRGYTVGELGHIPFGGSDQPCSCGNRGCLDVTASNRAMLRNYATRTGENITIEALNSRFQQGEEAARAVMEECADRLGRGCGALINLYGPEAIIIGGTVVHQNPHFLDLVKEATLKYALPVMSREVLLTGSQLKERSGLYGCVALVFQSTLQPYSLQSVGGTQSG